jgi:hypothetical protein
LEEAVTGPFLSHNKVQVLKRAAQTLGHLGEGHSRMVAIPPGAFVLVGDSIHFSCETDR